MRIDIEKYRAVARRWDDSEHLRTAAAACLIEQLCDEVARLRLTDAEREAVKRAVSAAEDCQHPADDTLRGLLERTE